MANTLPKNIQAKVKRIVFKKAEEFGYMECSRIDSGRFLDSQGWNSKRIHEKKKKKDSCRIFT